MIPVVVIYIYIRPVMKGTKIFRYSFKECSSYVLLGEHLMCLKICKKVNNFQNITRKFLLNKGNK